MKTTIDPPRRCQPSSTLRHTLVALLLVSTATTAAPAPPSKPRAPRPEKILSSLEPEVPLAGDPGWTLEERMRHHHVPAVSLAVWNDYEIVWTAAFGLADVEQGIAATPETLFQAGSISKSVAAAAVMSAVESGEIDLDAPIESILTSWKLPENELTAKASVTPRRLLSHTAGTTVHGFPGYAVDEGVPTLVQVLDGSPPANTPPVRVDLEPGTAFRYSGGGVTVMQLAMTDRFGLPYPELMRRRVLDPLGMHESTYQQPLPPEWLAQAAAGYRRDGRPVWGKRHTYPEMAAAGLWTTPGDLARFGLDLQRALRGDEGTLLHRETVEEMVTPVLGDSGLGLFRIESHGGLYFGHTGADEGFQALFVASREGGHGAAIMANSDQGIALASEILPAISRAYGWPGLAGDPLVPAKVGRKRLEALTGLYRIDDYRMLEISRRGNRLLGRFLLHDEPSRLIPRDDGSFVVQTSGEVLRFELDEKGRAVGYRSSFDEQGDLRRRVEATGSTPLELLDAGHTEQALESLAAADLEEKALNNLGYSLLRVDRPEEGVAVLRLMVARYPDSANAWDSLADGYEALDDREGLAEACREVLATLPGDDRIPAERKSYYETRARNRLRRLGAGPGPDSPRADR